MKETSKSKSIHFNHYLTIARLVDEASLAFFNMKETEMTQLKEATQIAVNTANELTLREQPNSNRILIKGLQQILKNILERLSEIESNTSQ